MQFTMYDLKPSMHVSLKYSADEFILLNNGRLANLTDGTCHLKIKEQFEEIKKVTKGDEVVAVKTGESLKRYDPTEHDPHIANIKRRNKLLSYEELSVELLRKKINHSNLVYIDYQKQRSGSYETSTGKVTCGVWKAEMKATQYIDGKIHKVNLVIIRYLIDKKRKIFLYKKQVTFSFL